MQRRDWQVWLAALIAACAIQAEAASYQQQINATRPAVVAAGSNSIVVQVETPSKSPDGRSSALHFAPDRRNPQFKGIDIRLDPAAKTSGHSDTVAQLLFGGRRSIARGIDTAYVYNSGRWLTRLLQWDLNPEHVSHLFPGAVVNHSYVASPGLSGKLLRRADYSALSNNVLHVAGVRRRGSGDALMAGGYNSLVVGGAVQNIATPYPSIDQFYGEGRTRPHLVGPYPHASAAVPIVAAAAVRLNALAAKNELVFPTTSRQGSEQLPVELIKAILMASASGDFEFTHKKESLLNGFGTLGITANGLDKRYGMGMINVGAAENILKTQSFPGDGSQPGPSAGIGYRYHAGIKGADCNSSAVFSIRPARNGTLTASLVWLADMRRDDNELVASVADYDLKLVADEVEEDTTEARRLAESAAAFDTTENVKALLKKHQSYQLIVTRKDSGEAPWPFAVAWYLAD